MDKNKSELPPSWIDVADDINRYFHFFGETPPKLGEPIDKAMVKVNDLLRTLTKTILGLEKTIELLGEKDDN